MKLLQYWKFYQDYPRFLQVKILYTSWRVVYPKLINWFDRNISKDLLDTNYLSAHYWNSLQIQDFQWNNPHSENPDSATFAHEMDVEYDLEPAQSTSTFDPIHTTCDQEMEFQRQFGNKTLTDELIVGLCWSDIVITLIIIY